MRTIVESARAEIYAKELGQKLWAEALSYSVFTINQTGTSSVEGKSPAELWFGKKVNINTLKQFGCDCFVLTPDHERKKLDKKSRKGMFVGYDIEEQGYRVYLPEKQQIEVSCNVLFKEKFDFGPNSIEINLSGKNQNESEVISDDQEKFEQEETKNEEPDDDQRQEESNVNDGSSEESEDEESEQEDLQPRALDKAANLRDRRQIKPHPKYRDYYTGFIGEIENMSVEEAMKDDEWKRAMEDEVTSLNKMQTWELTSLPKNRRALTCKWVFRIKSDRTKKARLVARGYDQKQGVDYFETFSPVARYASIRIVLSHANQQNFFIETFDIKTAFLNGILSEDIYMTQPGGFEDGTYRVCKLFKSIYGLKQAPKAWNERITKFLKGLGFEPTDDDPCIFYNKERKIIMGIFVDDGLITGHDEKEVRYILSKLSEEFEITTGKGDKEKLYYLGMDIHLKENGIFINQPEYTRKILEKFGYGEAYEASTPMEPRMLTDKHVNDKDLVDKPYREVVGSLLYLSIE